MGYKLLGFVVWKGGKWYIGRRLSAGRRDVALAGLSAAVLAGLLAAQRQRSTD